jgi:hypothetical protein
MGLDYGGFRWTKTNMIINIHECAILLTRVDREHQQFDRNWTRENYATSNISDQLVDRDHQKVNRSRGG